MKENLLGTEKVSRPLASVHLSSLNELPKGNKPYWLGKGFSFTRYSVCACEDMHYTSYQGEIDLLGTKKVLRACFMCIWGHCMSYPGKQTFFARKMFLVHQECKMSHSGNRKTFPAFGNAKGLLPGTQGVFRHGECEKIYGWLEKCPGINSKIVYPW